MARKGPELRGYQRRLLNLLNGIEDGDFRDMLLDVIVVEGKHRSAGRFPVQEIRDVVDNHARLAENETQG